MYESLAFNAPLAPFSHLWFALPLPHQWWLSACLLQNTMKARFLARQVADWPSAACNTLESLHSFNSQMSAETLGTFLGKVKLTI